MLRQWAEHSVKPCRIERCKPPNTRHHAGPLMGWSGRAPAPAAIEAAVGRPTSRRMNLSQCGNWHLLSVAMGQSRHFGRGYRPRTFPRARKQLRDSIPRLHREWTMTNGCSPTRSNAADLDCEISSARPRRLEGHAKIRQGLPSYAAFSQSMACIESKVEFAGKARGA